MRKKPNIAGIAWLVFVGLAAATAQSVPLVQTLWLARSGATMRQASHEPERPGVSPGPASHAAGGAGPTSTAG
ncbi:MAG: hypothetical protein DYG94_10725 [Leptolyngbya sp. PLA3]|nr:MAG: hypothetical protein EDM82_08190 [Cyanobacteria bacterium CYA]MCE7969204.1 hypothetical protein [Leptolyngbya sp. PL-A3]